MFRLEGKIAIVTGGARGIGAETARVFRDAGATVVVWDIAGAADMKVDVTDTRQVEEAVSDVVARYGRLDILVNNAGIVRDAQLVKLSDGVVTSVMSDAQ